MTSSAQLAQILQLTDSLFPVGAFAYSDGLESAAAGGRVRDGRALQAWLDHFIDGVFVPCEGLAVLKAMRAAEHNDWAAIRRIDDELTALKPAAATRAASRSIGKRLITTCGGIAGSVPNLSAVETLPHCNAPVAYALVLFHRGIGCRDALVAFGYVRLAGIISSALRLLALGQQEGQALLARSIGRLVTAVEQVLAADSETLRSFSPLLDIEQMNHRYLYSRIFRS